jgi:hypothetical protein
MTIIKRRPRRIPIVRHVSRLRQPNRDLLVAYAGFIGDSPDYVINQLIETVLAKDREFTAWRGDAAAEGPSVPAGETDTSAPADRSSAARGPRS